jgi:hypothetical protein
MPAGSTVALCADGDARILERQYQWPIGAEVNSPVWTDSALGTPEFICLQLL